MRWKTNIAMTIAKRGAQVALWRAHAVGVEQRSVCTSLTPTVMTEVLWEMQTPNL